MVEGIASELSEIDLGDARLNKRSRKILVELAKNPEASINGAHDYWRDTQAAYRFFDNPQVTPAAILAPHRAATLARMREHPVALVVQDTTEFDLSAHPPRDARHLNEADRSGFYDHTHLALTPERLCLGVVGSEQYDRAAETLGQSRARKALPIEQKESMRWLRGIRLASELQGQLPTTRVVSVADSEADIYELLVEVGKQATPAAYVVRSYENRCTTERDATQPGQTFVKVRARMDAAPVRLQRTIALPQTPKRKARLAHLEIRTLAIELKPPRVHPDLPAVTTHFVLVREVGGPGDGTAVEWLLLSDLPLESDDDVLRIIDYYVARWTIEVYFRTLKTGCRVEQIQLETLARVKNCLAFYKIIAWQVLHLTYLNRTVPDIPCTAVFTDDQWQPVWLVLKKKPLPKEPPRLGEFIRLLAQLGGYNNRRTEPEPGPQVLWTACRRMLDITLGWQAFGDDQRSCV